MIKAINAYIGYSNNIPILRNINLEINNNSVLIGPNGSGKTTFLNAILGFSKVLKGKLLVFGIEVSNLRNFLGITSNMIDVYKILSVKIKELIEIYAELYGVDKAEIFSTLRYFNFNSFDKKLHELSLGQQKIIGNSLALASNPKLALLDEPFENLDPTKRLKLIRMLTEFRKGKVILTSHEIDLVKKLKDWNLYLVFNGSIYGPFLASKINELYISKGKIENALFVINTNNGYLSITENQGDLPLSSIGDIENLEVMLND